MKANKFIPAVKVGLIAVGFVAFAGCSAPHDDNSSDDAKEMYGRMLKLTLEYTDSMRQAPDSVRALDLDLRLQEALAAITMQYPPETDARFPEGATDTLSAATEFFAEMRREAMLRKDTMAAYPVDSIPPSVHINPEHEESVR